MDLLCINLYLIMLVDMYGKPREEKERGEKERW